MKSKYLTACLLILIACIIYLAANNGAGASYCLVCIAILIISLIAYFINQSKSDFKVHWGRPSNLLLFGLLIVNFQYIIDLLIGYKNYIDFVYPHSVYLCCAVCTLGVVSFIAGSIICRGYQVNNIDNNHGEIGLLVLNIFQISFFALWLSSLNVAALITGQLYGLDNYTNLTYEELLSNSSNAILATIMYNSQKHRINSFKNFIKSNSSVSWIIFISYMLIRLLSGDRGPFIYTALALFFTYIFVTKKRISLKLLLCGLTIFSIIVTIVGMTRGSTAESNISNKIAVYMNTKDNARFSDKTILNVTEELAMSYRCNEIAVAKIQSGESLHYGKYQLYEILNCIPYMPSFLSKQMGIPLTELSSDYLLTESFLGGYTQSQIGTTCIADFYLDFGVIGVIMGMFFMGIFFKRIDGIIYSTHKINILLIIIAIVYTSHAIYIPRSIFIGQMKPVVQVIIFFYINKFCCTKKSLENKY